MGEGAGLPAPGHPGSASHRHLIPRSREGKWRRGPGARAARIGFRESDRCPWYAKLFVRGGFQTLARHPAKRVQAWHTSQAGNSYLILIPPKGRSFKWFPSSGGKKEIQTAFTK